MQQNNLALGRAYHAINLNACTLRGYLAIWRPAGLTMHFVYYLNFLSFFGAWQDLKYKLCIILILFYFPYWRPAGLTVQ